MWVYFMISVRPAGRQSIRRDKNFNVAIFSYTIKVINVKLCMMVLFIELYTFIPLSMTLNICPPRAHLHVMGIFWLCLWHKLSELAHSFFLFFCLFLSLWPFQLYLIPQILPTTLSFLNLFFRSYFCLRGPFNYVSLCVSLPQPWYNPSWLTGLKPPANQPTLNIFQCQTVLTNFFVSSN